MALSSRARFDLKAQLGHGSQIGAKIKLADEVCRVYEDEFVAAELALIVQRPIRRRASRSKHYGQSRKRSTHDDERAHPY
jgi:hypothetical protein